MLVVCIAQQSWAGSPPSGGSMSGNVAVYNAALVTASNGVLTVPSGGVTYTANTAVPAGTRLNVMLPKGFEFTTVPTLTNSAATFSLLNSDQILNTGAGTALFVVAGADVPAASTIVLGGYSVKGATALGTLTPIGAALPVSMQAMGIDETPVHFGEFASESGMLATFTGNSLVIDLGNANGSGGGKKFYASPDTLTAVLGTVEMTSETSVFGSSVPLLAPDGTPNSLNPSDTVTFQLPGYNFAGITVYGSSAANCSVMTYKGTVTPNLLAFANLPLGQPVYLCVQAKGNQLIKLFGYPDGETTFGFSIGYLINSNSATDYISSGNVAIPTTAAHVCYANAPPADMSCAPIFYKYFTVQQSAP